VDKADVPNTPLPSRSDATTCGKISGMYGPKTACGVCASTINKAKRAGEASGIASNKTGYTRPKMRCRKRNYSATQINNNKVNSAFKTTSTAHEEQQCQAYEDHEREEEEEEENKIQDHRV
jgi:hypothetical protein